jgi:hypothetical protein
MTQVSLYVALSPGSTLAYKANSHAACQEFPHLFSKGPATVTYRKPDVNPIHNFPPYFLKIHSNIILPYMPRSRSQ